ncbi:thyroid adenoma-associated protein homolog isoform X1 [Synchiropus splendidus]|uniref:thyroid adenoma-associated protein homolog isoform X1 n=3 Tax=Synchiropus splendidus TaxID=270530 RepID=UPI00237E311F|nr:thyroid adenoma-associated protein homolog isoform X1 [Synchiropus splendidus]
MWTPEELTLILQGCLLSHCQLPENTKLLLGNVLAKLLESSRSSVKRSKEKFLDEAVQMLRKVPQAELASLEAGHLQQMVRLLLSLQLQMANISTACRKVDQLLQHLATVDQQLVYRETEACMHSTSLHGRILCLDDLQRACMFLQDSSVGREVWRESHLAFMTKVSELLPHILQQESHRDGLLCYTAVKVCLQIFQMLPCEVRPGVWYMETKSPTVQKTLQFLMNIILGQCQNRDTRLLAGTAVAMLINTSPDTASGGAAAHSLLQVFSSESLLLRVGVLQVNCVCTNYKDQVGMLAIMRGLLTCSRSDILLTPQDDDSNSLLLLDGMFAPVFTLCEARLDSHFAFEVLTLWMKKVKECCADIWKRTDVRLLPDDGKLLHQLVHICWSNTESPVECVSEHARSSFSLLLELYQMDCEQFGDTKVPLYTDLLHQVIKLPWETKARYLHLSALLPYLHTDTVLSLCPQCPSHILKCLSTNHLSPCASELYKSLIQQQRCRGASLTEQQLVNQWSRRWQQVLLAGLTSDLTLVQSNISTHLLPSTFHTFPTAVEPLLLALDLGDPGHLRAWAAIMSSYRATTGASPWTLPGHSTQQTLHRALGSADDKVRLAALNLLCCCPKTRESPTIQEMSIMRSFIPENLNCESSPFRQHFQMGVRKFLVRVRDSCLALARTQKSQTEDAGIYGSAPEALNQGIGFVDWLSELPYCYLAPGHSYQRKKTSLLMLSAVLETCTDTWSPNRRKGQPPVNMGSLVKYAQLNGLWNFFCRAKHLVLISCLEDSTNEIRELSAELLLKFFPPRFPDDVAAALLCRTKELLCSPRVHQAQMGAVMMKVLFHKSLHQHGDEPLTTENTDNNQDYSLLRFLVKELEEHYLAARGNMMLAARTKPVHGVLSALQRCVLDASSCVCSSFSRAQLTHLLALLENISLLLLGVLHGEQVSSADEMGDTLPSFCDMGNAISSLIAQSDEGHRGDEEECVLLSEEHSLVLTCCWVSLKETGIFLGSLVEKVLAESKGLLTKEDLIKASDIFKNILLKCRHWGAVEGCCVGFTRFCGSLLGSSDSDLKEIPAHVLRQGLQVLKSQSSTSVTRRAAGLPMLILCVLSAEDNSKARPLLAHSVQTLLETARTPLPENWDQTLDLSQVCAVHTLQALIRGSGLGVAVLQFAASVAILSLTLLSSPCWAMRNAALQLYSSLCSRMLGQRHSGKEGDAKHGMSPSAFFFHYAELQAFVLAQLREAAEDLQGSTDEARLRLQPALFPILTLLAQLQPGLQDPTGSLADFLQPLLQLSSSPIYNVRVMSSKALVAMAPPSEYMKILIQISAQLPSEQGHSRHNLLHGQLLQMKALTDRVLCTESTPSEVWCEVLEKVEASIWLAGEAQRCPLVRVAYLDIVSSLREFFCESYLSQLHDLLTHMICAPKRELQVGLACFHQRAVQFLCEDQQWTCDVFTNFSATSPELKQMLVTWLTDGQALSQNTRGVISGILQCNLREALMSDSAMYRKSYLAALAAMTTSTGLLSPQHPSASHPSQSDLHLCLDLLFGDLEQDQAGPELLSHTLLAASSLLAQLSSLKVSVVQRWCGVLESHCTPDVAEVLRMVCADALCVAGVNIINHIMEESHSERSILIRLLSCSLCLLQDQSQAVRTRASGFISLLLHVRAQKQGSVHHMQVNQAVPLVLDLLLEECWNTPGALEALLRHVPLPDLDALLKEASDAASTSLYQQDDANVFAEPAVMSLHALPLLLRLVQKQSQSPKLTASLRAWAEEHAGRLLHSLTLFYKLHADETLTPAWLSLLTDPGFHMTVTGLLTRSVFLLALLQTCEDPLHTCDASTLQSSIQDVHTCLLRKGGFHFPALLTAAVIGRLDLSVS